MFRKRDSYTEYIASQILHYWTTQLIRRYKFKLISDVKLVIQVMKWGTKKKTGKEKQENEIIKSFMHLLKTYFLNHWDNRV